MRINVTYGPRHGPNVRICEANTRGWGVRWERNWAGGRWARMLSRRDHSGTALRLTSRRSADRDRQGARGDCRHGFLVDINYEVGDAELPSGKRGRDMLEACLLGGEPKRGANFVCQLKLLTGFQCGSRYS
jgi:hypothetical protein